MESQRRDCKHESEFGGGRAGTCPHCGVYIDVSGVATDVKLFHEAGCRLVHRYWIYRDPLPHVSLRGKVMSKLHAFVNRTMVVAQLTHLHLSIPSSGTTTEPVPPECFPVVPLPRKSLKVSFASPGEVPDSPDRPISNLASSLRSDPRDALNHEQPAFTIAPPAYVLFPFADPFDEGEMWSTPRFLHYQPLRDLLRLDSRAHYH